MLQEFEYQSVLHLFFMLMVQESTSTRPLDRSRRDVYALLKIRYGVWYDCTTPDLYKFLQYSSYPVGIVVGPIDHNDGRPMNHEYDVNSSHHSLHSRYNTDLHTAIPYPVWSLPQIVRIARTDKELMM